MDKYSNVGLNTSNGFQAAPTNYRSTTPFSDRSQSNNGMASTMKDFNKRASPQPDNYRAIDLQRDKFNKTATSGFGNFQTVGQGQKAIIGSQPMSLPSVDPNAGFNTTMSNYNKISAIEGMSKPRHNRNATPILSSVRETGFKKNNFMAMVQNDEMNRTARNLDYAENPTARNTFQSPGKDTDATPRSALGLMSNSKSYTAKPEKKRHQSVGRPAPPVRQYALSVSDTVKMGSKKTAQTGIPGYEMKLWHHDVDKPIVFGIHKEIKPRHYLDDLLRSKKHVPDAKYQIAKDFTFKQNMLHQKSPRITVPMMIEKREKKLKFPEPASYKVNHRLTENRLLGCFGFKSERNGYIEESFVIGKEQAPYYNKNYVLTDEKLKYPKIYNPVPEKPKEKTSLSPASYKPMESYKGTQGKKPNVYISKYRNENFIESITKKKKWVPGAGTYKISEKGESFCTKGLAKGWK